MSLVQHKRQSVPLHVEVASLLRHQIMSGTLPAGSQLPPLSELTQTMGVARMTIRQAMDSLEGEGLIERHLGRGTFVRQVELPKRHTLKMKAELEQLQSMVSQLEVSVLMDSKSPDETVIDGRLFKRMKRIHAQTGDPFCLVDVQLDGAIYHQAPQRFTTEIVVSVLKDLGIEVASARQKVTIAYADFEIAEVLKVSVNAPVFRVHREFFGEDGKLIYSASLIYPGDTLEFDIEFAV